MNFLSFHVFEKTKNENGAISVFNIKSKNEWTQHTRTQNHYIVLNARDENEHQNIWKCEYLFWDLEYYI